MDNINYEQEVKKVYPDAKLDFYYDGRQANYFIGCPPNSLSYDCDTEELAWKDAYKRLKQRGKL